MKKFSKKKLSKFPLILTLLVALAVGIVAFIPQGNTLSADQSPGVSTVLGDGMPLPAAHNTKAKVAYHHKGKIICVSQNAVEAHIAHGDTWHSNTC